MPEPTDGELMITYASDILVAATRPRAKTTENVDKCNSFIFKGDKGRADKNALKYVPTVKIRGQIIKNTNTLKYLGVVFQENLSYIKHVDYVLRHPFMYTIEH